MEARELFMNRKLTLDERICKLRDIGVVINGARRWLNLGIITIQPSEFLRVATVIILARQLASRQKDINKFILLPSLQFWNWGRSWQREKRIIVNNTIPVLGPVVLACAVILPAHTSSAAILFITCIFIMLLARVRRNDIWRVLLLAGLAAVLGIFVYQKFYRFCFTLFIGTAITNHGCISMVT